MMYAWAGESVEGMTLDVYSDADYAGCAEAQRSTTGSIVLLRRPDMSVPISFASKKQGCVSRSTVEAEIVAMDMTIRNVVLPLLMFLDDVFGRTKAKHMW